MVGLPVSTDFGIRGQRVPGGSRLTEVVYILGFGGVSMLGYLGRDVIDVQSRDPNNRKSRRFDSEKGTLQAP